MQDLLKLQELSKYAALEVGKFLLKNKNTSKKIFSEIGRDIKLELDREAEKKLRAILKQSNISVLGEEYGISLEAPLKWIVDPIDGTANYYRGLDQCCISIGLMQDENYIVGTIYNFNTNELYSAAKGLGATLNGEKITVSSISSKKQATITTGFPSSEPVSSSLEYLSNLKEWKKVRMFGSAALSCAYLAAGKCDYYSEKGVYLWDIAAGICLVREAGGCANFKLIDKERYEVFFSNNLLLRLQLLPIKKQAT